MAAIDRKHSVIRQINCIHIGCARERHRDTAACRAIRIGCILNTVYRSCHVLRIVTVSYCKKRLKASSRSTGCRREIHPGVGPDDRVQSVRITLVIFIIGRIAVQCPVIVSIDQNLSVDDHAVIRSAKVLSVCIMYFIFLCLNIYEFGKLIDQVRSLVAKLIRVSAANLDHIDLFI